MIELKHWSEHLESARLWAFVTVAALVQSARVLGRLFIEVITAVPANRWLVREAQQREQYIAEFEETAAKRIADRDHRITELESQLESLIASYSAMLPASTRTPKPSRPRRPVKRRSDNEPPT